MVSSRRLVLRAECHWLRHFFPTPWSANLISWNLKRKLGGKEWFRLA